VVLAIDCLFNYINSNIAVIYFRQSVYQQEFASMIIGYVCTCHYDSLYLWKPHTSWFILQGENSNVLFSLISITLRCVNFCVILGGRNCDCTWECQL